MIQGWIGSATTYPQLPDIKDYLDAIADAGRFRVDAFARDRNLAYSFLCQFRAGTALYHGTPRDFTDLGRVRILRGGFYTTWLTYARMLLWKGLADPTSQAAPEDARIFEFAAPAGDFLYVNSRRYTGYVIGNAQQAHTVTDAGTYQNAEFSQARNYAQHAKIFCNSVVNYPVPNLRGVIQGVSANAMDVGGMLELLLAAGPQAADNLAQRQRNFRILCGDIGGPRGQLLQNGFTTAVPHTLNNVSQEILAEFEELYWNDRQTPRRTHRLYGEAEEARAPQAPAPRPLRRRTSDPNLRRVDRVVAPARNREVNRLAEYRAHLIALLQQDAPGHQYCFDYRTYGPLLATPDQNGLPSPVSTRACLTPLRRTRDTLNSMCDLMLDRLQEACPQGIKKNLYIKVRQYVDRSSIQHLTPQEIDELRTSARLLRAQLP